MAGIDGYQKADNSNQDAYMAAQWDGEAGPSNSAQPHAGAPAPAQTPGSEPAPTEVTIPDLWFAAIVRQLKSIGFNRGINVNNIEHSIQADTMAIHELAHRQESSAPVAPATRAAEPRMRQPFTFDGTRDDDLVDEWVTTTRDYINFFRRQGGLPSDEDAVALASSYLHRDIKTFWTTRKDLEDLAQIPTTLESFFQTIRYACEEINDQERIRTKYTNLRQTKGVREYGYELLRLARKLVPKPPESEILEKFKIGLQGHVRIRLAEQFNTPTILGDYMDLCDRIDRNWYENRHIYCDQYRSTPSFNAMTTPLNAIASSA
jgi:hypothetical protein